MRFKKRSTRVDPIELQEKAEASLERTRKQQPYINFITSWLNNRKGENGFGEDFEYTLRPKGV